MTTTDSDAITAITTNDPVRTIVSVDLDHATMYLCQLHYYRDSSGEIRWVVSAGNGHNFHVLADYASRSQAEASFEHQAGGMRHLAELNPGTTQITEVDRTEHLAEVFLGDDVINT